MHRSITIKISVSVVQMLPQSSALIFLPYPNLQILVTIGKRTIIYIFSSLKCNIINISFQ